jgi:hypothetical protein
VRHAVAGVTLLAAVLTGCGGGDDDAGPGGTPATSGATTTTVPAVRRLCDAPAPEAAATVADPALVEVSGVVASRRHDGVLWVHNDSGDAARLFALDEAGTTVATLTLPGVTARDWEDVATDGDALYVGDIGDNARTRDGVVVAVVAEPEALADGEVDATMLPLRYPDGAHDAEALMVDPVDRLLVVVTKEPAGDSGVYVEELDAPDGRLERTATLALGVGQLVTAGDISARGDVVVLRTYTNVFVWSRREGEPLAGALARPPCDAPPPVEVQGEAIALDPGGRGYVTIAEGRAATVWRVTTSGPASTSTGGTTGTSSSG